MKMVHALRCQCVDAICSKNHKAGCLNIAVYSIILNKVKSTHNNPLHYCPLCAQFAECFCDAQPICYEVKENVK